MYNLMLSRRTKANFVSAIENEPAVVHKCCKNGQSAQHTSGKDTNVLRRQDMSLHLLLRLPRRSQVERSSRDPGTFV